MVKFLIAGDSWGCGEFSPESIEKKTTIISHDGLSQYLKEANHYVINQSCTGDNNLRQLRLINDTLKKEKFDHIIWIQTEPLRNIYQYSPFPDDQDLWNYDITTYNKNDYNAYDNILEDWFNLTYSAAQKIYDTFNIPFYIIGGLSPVHPIIRNYTFYNNIIESWNNIIMDVKQPYNTWFHTRKIIEDYEKYLNDKRMVNEIETCIAWETAQESHKNFIAVHPNRDAHKKLTDMILKDLGK